MGVTADEGGRPGRDALLPSLHNPKRALLQPVLIFSDNRPSPFVTVTADGVMVASKTDGGTDDDLEWAQNSPGLAAAKMHAKWDLVVSKYSPGMSPHHENEGDQSPASVVLSNWSTRIDAGERFALPSSVLHLKMNDEGGKKEQREERGSNDSVISDFLSKPLAWLGLA